MRNSSKKSKYAMHPKQNERAIRKMKALMSKRKHEQSFCYAPTRESGCILSMRFFSGNTSREWRRRKHAGIIHIPGGICRFALGFCKNIKKRTETLYQSFSPFMVEPRRVELLSEDQTTKVSPSAVRVLTFPPPNSQRTGFRL